MSKIDLHLHSSFSDGSDNAEELAEIIKQNNISIFALTDHDTMIGCKEIKKYIDGKIKFIPSIELTCKEKDVKCHILGINCNSEDENIIELVKKGKFLRRIKLDKRVEYLRARHGIELTPNELKWLYTRNSVVKTHIAQILVKRNLAEDSISAMKKFLDGCKTGDTRFSGNEAIRAIKLSGGIPIWAHPLGGEGETHLNEKEFKRRYKILKSVGIEGLECFYSRYSQAEIDFLVNFAQKNNILISGGSDYHGKNKDIPIAKLNAENYDINTEQLTVLKKIL